MKPLCARSLAATISYQVIEKNQSLSTQLDQQLIRCPAKDRPLVQELCYGVIRLLPRLDYWTRQLMDKPLKGKYRCAHFLILVGLYQLFYTRIPPHAAVSETVQASRELKLSNFSKLINGVLRSAVRKRDELMDAISNIPSLQFCHPKWLSQAIESAYPDHWQAILSANNERAPMWLRVNQRHQSTTDYLARLNDEQLKAYPSSLAVDALRLEQPVNVHKLPGFEQGDVSVQDGAAQMAARLLDPQPGEKILDACAAPGGKTGHLLEIAEHLDVMAIDVDQQRLSRVQENLTRLQLKANLKVADATEPQHWSNGPYDRILLDAPCSATGVIRRHPDIKWLRRHDDIATLAKLQRSILNALWQELKPGGTLLYATCSILPDENRSQIANFLAQQQDAELIAINDMDTQEQPGWQILPGEQHMDGFYYARLYKRC
ncbi:16S rRNA (cytosine(967)-C(5))-methyltransferase RsmB [Celerinatantimonas diazotrophica]|uniref:16S rRNA (cytosine(967)-C(5))-methyltransferase n=1 Tax=Celerinatantimonas diazotrophica TaxID=412034 RepID=A0A4R1J783_9GAMM|nr:16S rRNA (cytosine(967)-C(5))-methyltransferase RsmB [Celerinatantimonas diazotrophica]TCK46312.1 16S rRNA m(5)C-967 methyltransferase [Celerinatantimonas diazotrophica]CAG9295314.1 Ribosomal RNA small subunit methyltransferase B [Celerinatantimonas diazotrophica]